MTGRWDPNDEEAGEEDEEMARAVRAFNRKWRRICFFFLFPLVGLVFTLQPWADVAKGRPLQEAKGGKKFKFIVAVLGPGVLWFVAVRLVLATRLKADDELRTEEQDKRQKRLWKQYRYGAWYDWFGFALGFAHLAIVVVSFRT